MNNEVIKNGFKKLSNRRTFILNLVFIIPESF